MNGKLVVPMSILFIMCLAILAIVPIIVHGLGVLPGGGNATNLTVIKEVNNNFGGTAQSSSFIMNVSSNGTVKSFPGSSSGTTVTLGAGAYSVTESSLPGYQMANETASCSGTIAGNQSITCTIVNNDMPANLIVIDQVNNNFGGTAQPSSFAINIAGSDVVNTSFAGSSSGTTVTLGAGAYSVTESSLAGYQIVNETASCSGTIANNQTITCTIVNNDMPANLIVIKQVNNNFGGTALPSSFTMKVAGSGVLNPSFPGSSLGTTVTLNAGAYSVTESSLPGYQMANETASCSGTIMIGQAIICTIVNNDLPGRLKLIKLVNNTFGGKLSSGNFTLLVSGNSPSNTMVKGNSIGTTITIKQGVYNVTESPVYGYIQKSATNCAGTISIGQNITCIIVNHDVSPLVLKCTSNNDNNVVIPAASNYVNIVGNNQPTRNVTVTNSTDVKLTGNHNRINVKVTYSNTIGVVVSGNSDSAKLMGGNTNVSINGNSDSLYLANGSTSTVWVRGNADTVNLTNSAATIFINGNADNVHMITGGSVVCIYGNADTANMTSGYENVNIVGNADTAIMTNGFKNLGIVGNADTGILTNGLANIGIVGNADTVYTKNTTIISENVIGHSDTIR